MSNKIIVNSLWIGNALLKPIEILTVKSFIDMGAEFVLWHYDPIRTKLPKETILRDGRELIPEDKMFRYPENMMLGFGENSFVGFSEIFRYKTLYEFGGWWSDMDVVCLKPLSEINEDYWFRNHGVLSVVGNIMKCPAKSNLMKLCYEKAVEEVNAYQDDWHHAIRILCYYIEFLGLSKFIHKNECNLDRLPNVLNLLYDKNFVLPNEWRFIHWMNSVIPQNYSENSIMDNLFKKYKINKKTIV
jgi:hypothetical protein